MARVRAVNIIAGVALASVLAVTATGIPSVHEVHGRARRAVAAQEAQGQQDFNLLFDLEAELDRQLPPSTEYHNGLLQYQCDENFVLTEKACRDANAALARRAVRMRRVESERHVVEPPRPPPPPRAPELAIIQDLPSEPMTVHVGDPIRLLFIVRSMTNGSRSGQEEAPITYFWSKDVIHPADANEADGSKFYRAHAMLDDAGVYSCVASNADHVVSSRQIRVRVAPHTTKPTPAPREEITDWHPMERQYNLHMCHDELVGAPNTTLAFSVPPVCDFAVTLCYGAQTELCAKAGAEGGAADSGVDNIPRLIEAGVDGGGAAGVADPAADRCAGFDRGLPDLRSGGDTVGREPAAGAFQRRSKACGQSFVRAQIDDREADVWCEYDWGTDTCRTSQPARERHDQADSCRASLHKCHYLIRACFFKHSSAAAKHKFARCFFSRLVKPIQPPRLSSAGLTSIKVDKQCITGVDATASKLHYKYERPFDPDALDIVVEATPASHGTVTEMYYHEKCSDSDQFTRPPRLPRDGVRAKGVLRIPVDAERGVTCRYEVYINAQAQDGLNNRQYSVAVSTAAPDDSCTITDFAVADIPFTFSPASTYYAPLYTAPGTASTTFAINSRKKVGRIKLRNECTGKEGAVGKPMPLHPGPNRLSFRYTTQAKRQCQLYTLVVHRRILGLFQSHKSAQATLERLSVFGVQGQQRALLDLDPPFSPDWPLYRASVPTTVDQLSVQAWLPGGGRGAHITINGCGWDSGVETTGPIFLLDGPNVVDVEVAAANARDTFHYRLTVTRPPALVDGGNEGNALRALRLQLPHGRDEPLSLIGELPMLSRVVQSDVTMVFLDAKTEDPRSVVTIAGDAAYNGWKDASWKDEVAARAGTEPVNAERMKPYRLLPLQYGANRIPIEVVRGTAVRSYTLQLIRQRPPPAPPGGGGSAATAADSEATLSSLQVGPWSLDEQARWFDCSLPERQAARSTDAGRYAVDAYVHEAQLTFVVRAVTSHPDALVEVEGSAVRPGDFSQEIPTPWSDLAFDKVDNIYYITVTAEDGVTTATYELRLFKACPSGHYFDKSQDTCIACATAGLTMLGSAPSKGFLSRCEQATCTGPCDVACARCEEGTTPCANGHQCQTSRHNDKCGESIEEFREMCKAAHGRTAPG